MKARLAAFLIGLTMLAFPATLFAQTDGSAETPPPVQETPPAPAETAPAPAEPAASLAEPTPTSAPAPTSAPTPTPRATPPEAVPLVPPAAAAPVEAASTTPAPSLEEIQGMVDALMEEAPPITTSPWIYALLGALVSFVLIVGGQALSRRAALKGTKACGCCGGTGREEAGETCENCDGTGMVQEEHEATVECPHCGGEGEEPCERCKGEGEYDGKPCVTCEGAGVKKDEDGEPLVCAPCLGEGEATVTLKRDARCPDCKGAGK